MSDIRSISSVGDAVREIGGPVVVDLWAETCGPCLMLARVIDEFARQYQDEITFLKLNVDENEQEAEKLDVMTLPTLIFYNNGEEVDRVVGILPKSILTSKLDALKDSKSSF